MSRKEVISLLSDDSSNNPGPENDLNETNVNVDIPVNATTESSIANTIPVANHPPTFWSDPTDNFVVENNTTLSFTIRGAPVALRRPSVRRGYGASMVGRRGRGFGRPMYNPSHPKLVQFRSLLVGLLTPTSTPLPFFSSSVALGARLTFHLRRPNIHFVNSRRDRGLRANAPKTYVVGKVDLDNLVKFTLDAIGGVAFVDDGQIAELNCSKVWVENDGSTACIISKLVD
jgi:hypothetical protein